MQTNNWDFSLLPEIEYGPVIEAYNTGDIIALIRIHDQYKLSRFSYCCDQAGLLAWFKYGIENNFFSQGEGEKLD